MVAELGSKTLVHIHVACGDGKPHLLVVRAPGETTISRGDRVSAAFDGPVHVLDAEGERLSD